MYKDFCGSHTALRNIKWWCYIPCRSKIPQNFYFIIIHFRSVHAGRFQLNYSIFQYVLWILVSKGTIRYWKMNTCQECHDRARCLQRYRQILESVHSPEVRDRRHDGWFPDELVHLSLPLSCQPAILSKVCSASWDTSWIYWPSTTAALPGETVYTHGGFVV